MYGQCELYVPINLLSNGPNGPNLSRSHFFTITLCRNLDPTTNFPPTFCSLPKLNKTLTIGVPKVAFVRTNVVCHGNIFCEMLVDARPKSTEIYKNFVCFCTTDCTEISVFCGLNKTFIFVYHIQACQLAFVWACEIDSRECSGQHNRDKSSQWVGRRGRHWCRAAVSKKSF